MVGRWFGMLVGALVALLGSLGGSAAQDNFPSRSIRVVIPYGPGSVVDVFGRIVAQNIAAQWNNATIVFESKSGANGSIAAEDVARSAPDGYTWLLATTYFVASPALYNNLRWDPQRDFAAVGEICKAPNVFIVPSSLPVKNVAEFVALARSKPGILTYGHPGKGSTGHLGFELFKKAAGIDVTGVGYRGYPQMVPDIASRPRRLPSFFSDGTGRLGEKVQKTARSASSPPINATRTGTSRMRRPWPRRVMPRRR